MLSVLSIVISGLSLAIAGTTVWLMLWRRGTVRMGQPPTIYFAPDGGWERRAKVFVRALLYSTAARGRIVEGMYAWLTRDDSAQTFRLGSAERGAGRWAGAPALRCDRTGRPGPPFLLPRDGHHRPLFARAPP